MMNFDPACACAVESGSKKNTHGPVYLLEKCSLLEAGWDGKMVVTPPAAAGLLVQMDLGRLECTPPSGVLKISLAGANNLVPTTGLTPCIIIVHVYTCNYSGAEKKKPTPAGISWHLEWLHSANFYTPPPCARVEFRPTNTGEQCLRQTNEWQLHMRRVNTALRILS